MGQVEIQRRSDMLEEERQLFETFRREVEEKEHERKSKAAVEIQRIFRGHRTRVAMSSTMKELEESKKVRAKAKYDLRIMEVEYEMKYREEEALRLKKDQEKKDEEEKLRQEEEAKKQETERKRIEEEERMKKQIKIE